MIKIDMKKTARMRDTPESKPTHETSWLNGEKGEVKGFSWQ